MSAMEPLYRIVGIFSNNLTKQERSILEIEIFVRICEELKKIFKSKYKDYFYLMKFNFEMENAMLDTNLLKYVINDILLTEEYSMEGLAYYTQTSVDVISDLIAGRNDTPSVYLFRKIIDIHRSVRKNLYEEIIKKINFGSSRGVQANHEQF